MVIGLVNLILSGICFFLSGVTATLLFFTIKENQAGIAALNAATSVVLFFVATSIIGLI